MVEASPYAQKFIIFMCRESNTRARPLREGGRSLPGRSSILVGLDPGELSVARSIKPSIAPQNAVRTRRAYFDCRFGQLHVRTAFPTTGGFDEQVTLVCLHSREGSSRSFARLLPAIAPDRSVYAPDLPGFGESDPAPSVGHADAALAIFDLAKDLRLRQIDLLGVRFGAAVALELAGQHPELVRRLVLVGSPPMDRVPSIRQPCLILKSRSDPPDELQRGALPNARLVDVDSSDPIEADPAAFARQIAAFLGSKASA